jgi:hypothetical protein
MQDLKFSQRWWIKLVFSGMWHCSTAVGYQCFWGPSCGLYLQHEVNGTRKNGMHMHARTRAHTHIHTRAHTGLEYRSPAASKKWEGAGSDGAKWRTRWSTGLSATTSITAAKPPLPTSYWLPDSWTPGLCVCFIFPGPFSLPRVWRQKGPTMTPHGITTQKMTWICYCSLKNIVLKCTAHVL